MMREPSATNLEATDDDDTAREITTMVAGTERASGIVLLGLMAICIGVPLLVGLARGHPLLGLANATLLGLVGWGLAVLAHALILDPISAVRYARVATRLEGQLRAEAEPTVLHRSWSDGAPGAITVTEDGRVWLADRSTHYRPIMLCRADIRHVEAVSHYSLHLPRARRGAFGIGVPIGSGLMVTFARTPRPKAPRASASHALVIYYVERDDPTIRTTTIPFGSDMRGARLMAAILDKKPD